MKLQDSLCDLSREKRTGFLYTEYPYLLETGLIESVQLPLRKMGYSPILGEKSEAQREM